MPVGGLLEQKKRSEERQRLQTLQLFRRQEADLNAFTSAMDLIDKMIVDPDMQTTRRLSALGIPGTQTDRRAVRRELDRILQEAERTLTLATSREGDVMQQFFSREESEEAFVYWGKKRQFVMLTVVMLFLGISVLAFVFMPNSVARRAFLDKLLVMKDQGLDNLQRSMISWMWPAGVLQPDEGYTDEAGGTWLGLLNQKFASIFNVSSTEAPRLSLFGKTHPVPNLATANQNDWQVHFKDTLQWMKDATQDVADELSSKHDKELPSLPAMRRYLKEIVEPGQGTLAIFSTQAADDPGWASKLWPFGDKSETIARTIARIKETLRDANTTPRQAANALLPLLDRQATLLDELKTQDRLNELSNAFFASQQQASRGYTSIGFWRVLSWVTGVDWNQESAVDSDIRKAMENIGLFWTSTGYSALFIVTSATVIFGLGIMARFKKQGAGSAVVWAAIETGVMVTGTWLSLKTFQVFVGANPFFKGLAVGLSLVAGTLVYFTNALKLVVGEFVPFGEKAVAIFDAIVQEQKTPNRGQLIDAMQGLSETWRGRPPQIYEGWKKQIKLLAEGPTVELMDDEDEEEDDSVTLDEEDDSVYEI